MRMHRLWCVMLALELFRFKPFLIEAVRDLEISGGPTNCSAAFCVCLRRWGHVTLSLHSHSGFTCCGSSVNFQILPLQVLTSRQRRLIDALCAESRFVPLTQANEWEVAILGTLERRPLVEVTRAERSGARISEAVSSFAADA
jgi:hypothetical protein